MASTARLCSSEEPKAAKFSEGSQAKIYQSAPEVRPSHSVADALSFSSRGERTCNDFQLGPVLGPRSPTVPVKSIGVLDAQEKLLVGLLPVVNLIARGVDDDLCSRVILSHVRRLFLRYLAL